MEFINNKLYNISMSFKSCKMDHGVSKFISFVEQWVHLWGQVLNDVDVATPCSEVQGIAFKLQSEYRWTLDCLLH